MCPYLEKSDPRCATHMNMRNIVQTFAHCVGRYDMCPVYQECQSPCRHECSSPTDAFVFLAAS